MPDRVPAGREFRYFLTALLLYGGFYAAFFLQSFLSGNYIAPSDSLDFGVADYLSRPALWTQAMFSGYPIAADPQALTWYPLLRLFRVLGIDWNVFLISAYVIASATGYLLVRRLTGSHLAGAFSGFVCGFNALMLGYIANFNQIHAFAWVPLVFFGLQLIREGLHRVGVAVTALACALMWLAGHPQIPVYALYLAGAIVVGTLVLDRPPARAILSRLLCSGGALVLGIALAAIALVPMIELGGFSPRADSSWQLYSSSALPPRELLTLLWPFVFGGFWSSSGDVPYLGETGDSGYAGLLPVALALAAPFVLSSRRGEARLWVGLAVVEAILCLGPATPLGTLMYYMPGYANFQAPLRQLFLVSLCVAVASGFAFAELTRREHRSALAASVLATTLLAAIAFALFVWQLPTVRALISTDASFATWAIGWPLALAGGLVALALLAWRLPDFRGGAAAFSVVLIAVHVGDLAMVHYRLPGRRFAYADILREETIPRPRIAALGRELEQTGERVMVTDGSRNPFLLPNLTRAWAIPTASGTGSLAIRRYLDVLGMDTAGGVPPESLSESHVGIDLFAIRYVLVRQDSSLASDLARQAERWDPIEELQYYESDPQTAYTLFKNRRALPRAWCASRLVRVKPADALTSIRGGRLPDESTFDPAQSALVESDVLKGWNEPTDRAAGKVVPTRTGFGHYRVDSADPCLLVLSEVHYPWWRASIDDRPVELARVNYTMLGIAVPPGSHSVRVWIEPVSVWIGAAVSGVSLLVWLGFVFFRWNKRSEAQTPVNRAETVSGSSIR